MAITISGENNNDRILASDGVIDQLSGFNVVGVITATSFTGDLTGNVTGNVTGNLTGNVNHTSNLLLQISGSEKFRVGGSGQLGIGGANYGTSGQVLTSGGSGSAASWTTIPIEVSLDTSPALGGSLDAGTRNIFFGDGNGTNTAELRFGNGTDLRLFHNGTDSRIINTTGDLSIRSNSLKLASTTGEEYLRGTANGSVDLFHDNVVKLTTNTDGYRSNDDVKAQFGNSSDLTIYHSSSDNNSYIKETGSGSLVINADDFYLQNNATTTFLRTHSSGAIDLNHSGSKKLETTSAGVFVTGALNVTTTMHIPDGNVGLQFGNSNDMIAYHNGSNSFIQHQGTGSLYIDSLNNSADIYIRSKDNLHLMTKNNADNSVVCVGNGGVILYNAGSQKFTTNGDGIAVTGRADPAADSAHDLGTNATRWRTLYSDTINVSAHGGSANGSVANFRGGTYNQINIANANNSGWGLLLTNTDQATYGNNSGYHYSTNTSINSPCAVVNVNSDALHLATANTSRWFITHGGNLLPYANGSYDLGGSSNRVRNIYGQTLSLTSYATIASLVVNDPGSAYYSFNNRFGGNTIIKGTTVCTSDVGGTKPSTFPASNVQLMVYNSTNGQPISNTNCARLLIATDAKQTGAQGYHGSLDFGSSDCTASGGPAEFQYRVAAIMCRGDGDTSPAIGDGDIQFWTKTASGSLTHHFDIAPNGTLTGTDTSIGSLSDQRLKTNIQDYSYDLNKFKQLKTRTFDWINPEFHQEGNQRGFVAQEVETVDPYWNYQFEVSKESAKKDYDLLSDGDENYTIRDHRPGKASKLNGKDAMYVSVIQQLMSKIEILETKVAALESS